MRNARSGTGLLAMDLKNILVTTTVGEMALAETPVLTPSDTIAHAIDAMRGNSHGCAVVCDGKQLRGIFTERDLLRIIAGGDLSATIETVMTVDLTTVSTGDTLFTATGHMDRGGYRRLPVLDDDGQPVGILDVKAITHFIVEHFPAAVYNQAAHAQLIARHREGA